MIASNTKEINKKEETRTQMNHLTKASVTALLRCGSIVNTSRDQSKDVPNRRWMFGGDLTNGDRSVLLLRAEKVRAAC